MSGTTNRKPRSGREECRWKVDVEEPIFQRARENESVHPKKVRGRLFADSESLRGYETQWIRRSVQKLVSPLRSAAGLAIELEWFI
jgi:hypothetical protein